MSIHLSEIVVSILNFLIFYLIVRKFFFGKIKAAMDQRTAMIQENMEQAAADRTEAESLLAKATQDHRTAKQEGVRIINDYKKKAEVLYDDILEDARTEARLIVQRGTLDADREREQARKETRRSVVELASTLSRKAIGEDATEATHDRLINDILGRMDEA